MFLDYFLELYGRRATFFFFTKHIQLDLGDREDKQEKKEQNDYKKVDDFLLPSQKRMDIYIKIHGNSAQ